MENVKNIEKENEPDLEKKAPCAKLQAVLLGSLQKLFFQQVRLVMVDTMQGRLVGRYPAVAILLTLIVSAACCSGFARFFVILIPTMATLSRDYERKEGHKAAFIEVEELVNKMMWPEEHLAHFRPSGEAAVSAPGPGARSVDVIVTAPNVLEPSVMVATVRLLQVLLWPCSSPGHQEPDQRGLRGAEPLQGGLRAVAAPGGRRGLGAGGRRSELRVCRHQGDHLPPASTPGAQPDGVGPAPDGPRLHLPLRHGPGGRRGSYGGESDHPGSGHSESRREGGHLP